MPVTVSISNHTDRANVRYVAFFPERPLLADLSRSQVSISRRSALRQLSEELSGSPRPFADVARFGKRPFRNVEGNGRPNSWRSRLFGRPC